MIYQEKSLNEICKSEILKESKATLVSYVIENSERINPNLRRPAVIICPGGAYERVSEREGEPVAQRFNVEGISSFVLKYSVEKESIYPMQLLELSATVAFVRENAEKFFIDKDKIIILGFSAGGHLVGNFAVAWKEKFLSEKLNLNCNKIKPNAMVLGYPVITGGEYKHKNSFKNLLGCKYNEDNLEKLSLENLVNKDTPKTFIWSTMEDGSVPIENTMMFVKALRKNNIVFELHIYTKGVHGLSLANENTANYENKDQINKHVSTWFNLCVQWIKENV